MKKRELTILVLTACTIPPTVISQVTTNYIDPGSGSMVLQVVIAAALSVGVLIKIFWNRIKLYITSLFKRKGRDG